MKGIYKIVCKEKVYIGQSINLKSRIKNHKYHLRKNTHRNKYLQRAYNLYEKLFKFEVIECVLVNDLDYLNEREVYWIDFHKSLENQNGFNLTKGGRDKSIIYPYCVLNSEKFRKSFWHGNHTEETKALISNKNKGNKYALGAKRSKEYKNNMSKIKKDFYKNKTPHCSNKEIFIYKYKDGTEFIGPRYALKQKLNAEGLKVSSSNLSRLEKDSSKHCRGWKLIACKLN